MKNNTKQHLAHVGSRLIDRPVMLWPPKMQEIIGAVGERTGIDAAAAIEALNAAGITSADIRAGMLGGQSDDQGYEVFNGIAVIPVQGTLLKKETWLSAMSGSTSYAEIQRQLAGAVADAGVRGILLHIDSPGGEVSGCFELSDYIYSVRGLKPIYAVADDYALSAAYAIASAADKIFVTRTGCVGSIGVYALHSEQSGFDKQIGVTYRYVYNGAKKVDGNPHEALSAGAEADIQAEVDREAGIFHATVARNRKADEKQIVATKAGLLWAENAIPLLADGVGTFDDVMASLSVAATRQSTMHAAAAAIPAKGEAPMTQTNASAAAEEQLKVAATPTTDTDPDDPDPDDPNEQNEDEMAKKKAAATTAVLPINGAPATAAAPSRSIDDIKAISALCNLAGCADKATAYLSANKSVAEVSDLLTAARVAESEKTMIDSHVNPNKNASARIQDLEAEAVAFSRQNKGVTKEQAFARMLEANPEVYGNFRVQHNAKALMATLEAAGFQVQVRQ